MGAGIALAVGAVAVGCSSSKSSGGFSQPVTALDLNNGDNAPMSSIATNNLSADGAGFSGSNQNFVQLACVVNKKPSNTDGPAASADGSAIVAFQTADQLDGHFRLYMSYFDGSAFTPPIEVTGADRDEYKNAGTGNTDVSTGNILMIPLNTSGYKGVANSTTGDAGAVRANSGNWVIVWDATTYSTVANTTGPNPAFGPGAGGATAGNNVGGTGNFNPNNSTSQQWFATSTAAVPNIVNQRIQQSLAGPHRALYETLFVKSLHGTPSAFSTVLGTNAASTSATTAASREYRYGFLVTAPQITTLNRGLEVGFSSTQVNNVFAGNAVAPDILSPAEDVTSYGFASDGQSGCATFTGNTTPLQGSAATLVPSGLGAGFAFVDQPHTFLGVSNHSVAQVAQLPGTILANVGPTQTPGGASYTVGEDVTFVQLLWTQIVSSAHSGDSPQAMTPTLEGNDQNLHVGNRLAMFRTGLDLRTLQFESANAATQPTEVKLGTLSTQPAQPLAAAESPLGTFTTYNQFVFANFVDASIAHTDQTGLSGNFTDNRRQFVVQNASVREFNLALLAFTVTDNGTGTSTVGGTAQRLSVVPTSAMDTDNLDTAGGINGGGSIIGGGDPNATSLEVFGNQDQAWLVGGSCCVVGPDEGLGDTTVFFFEHHSSAADGTDANLDTELCAGVLKGDGSLQTPGTNPVRLSVHAAENTDAFNVGSSILNVVGHPNQGALITGTTNVTGPNGSAQPASGAVFQDPVEGVSCCMNRTGQYVVITYRQFTGTSSGSFHKGLNAVVMKTFRFASSQNSATAGVPFVGSTGTAPQVDTRFAAPTAVDTSGTGTSLSQLPNSQVPNAGNSGASTLLSSGFLNMFYSPNNGLLNGNAFPVFPSQAGVNSQLTAPCGYRCGFQSDTKLVNVLWEQSDSSEDRVFVRQLSIDITGNTPVVSAGGVDELEKSTPAKGDATTNLDAFGSVGQTLGGASSGLHNFIDNDAFLGFSIQAGDLGADSAKKGGGLLIVYAKTTDATTTDGNFYNRNIIAAQWDGSQLSNRTVIDRGINENAVLLTAHTNSPSGSVSFGNYVVNTGGGNYSVNANGLGPTTTPAVQFSGGIGTPGGVGGVNNHALKTNLANVTQVPSNPDITGSPTLSPKNTYVYFVTPNGDNTDTGVGLYTRTFNHALRAQANNTATFGDQFVPKAATGPGATGFAQPERMDHMTGGDVTGVLSVNTDGTTATVLMWQDGHLWLSGTSDGATQDYTNDGKGSSDPFLVDNDSSASAQFASVTSFTDSKCNTLHHTIVFFGKNDLSQTNSANGAGGNKANGGVGGNGTYGFRLRLRTFN